MTWINLPLGPTDKLEPGFVKARDLPKSTIQEQKKILSVPPTVTLPEKTFKTLPEKDKKPAVKKEVPLSPAAQKQKEQDELMKKALARIGEEVKKNKVIQPEVGQIPAGKAGGVPFGSPGAVYVSRNDPEYLLYQAKIREKIMSQWLVPLTLQGLDLSCQLVVHINEKGEVLQTEWERKSGSEALDLSVLRAVERASPLDIPPDRLKPEAINEGFLVEFNTRQKGSM